MSAKDKVRELAFVCHTNAAICQGEALHWARMAGKYDMIALAFTEEACEELLAEDTLPTNIINSGGGQS